MSSILALQLGATATPTNPYLESIIFRWVYVLPLVFLDISRRGNDQTADLVGPAQAACR